MSKKHDHPTTCAVVAEMKVLECRVAAWAEAKPRTPAEVNAVVTLATKLIERGALLGSVTEPGAS